ncbi:MAG: hypothetical protein QM536_03015 [Chitinophagaceae bacterium]|nr:hypothetical protein [Chitinophagaceae bacterium]
MINETILQDISKAIETGFVIAFKDVKKSDIPYFELKRIAKAISDGYAEGEIIIDTENSDKNGYWKIYFE